MKPELHGAVLVWAKRVQGHERAPGLTSIAVRLTVKVDSRPGGRGADPSKADRR